MAAVLTVLLGVLRGHDRYGTHFLSEPTRFLLYAGIAAAIADMEPRRAYRGIVLVFYVGTVWQLLEGAYYLATGRSQTGSVDLSTGGTRVLALSTAMYLAGALILALLNLDMDRGGRRTWLHLTVAMLAALGIVLSLGRTTFVALGALLPILAIVLRHTRRSLLLLCRC